MRMKASENAASMPSTSHKFLQAEWNISSKAVSSLRVSVILYFFVVMTERDKGNFIGRAD